MAFDAWTLDVRTLLGGSMLLWVVYYITWIIYARTGHPLAKYPGPFVASFSRFWLGWRVWYGDADVVERRLHAKHGKFVRIAPDEIAISDPDAVKTIYGINSGFTKTDFYLPWRADFSRIPDLFTQTDEKVHTKRRRIVNSLYSMSNIVQNEPYIENCVLVFMQQMEQFASEQRPFDLARQIQWYAFDVIGELYFSQQFGFLERQHDHGGWIGALNTLMPVMATVSSMPTYLRPLLLLSSLAIPGATKAVKAFKSIALASETCVTERIEALQRGQETRKDILEQLLEIQRDSGEKLDFQTVDVKSDIYTTLFAGSDTTMIAICSIMYHLLKNPTALVTLREELDAATRDGRLSNPVRYGEAVKLGYLSACIQEGLRLHPSVGLSLPRNVPSGGRTISGDYFPGGVRVGVNAAVIHLEDSHFGPHADQFRPERWLAPGAERIGSHLFTFGAGARSCIGKNISLCEMYKLIPQLFREYDVELTHGSSWEWKTANHWMHKPKSLPVEIQRRARKERA